MASSRTQISPHESEGNSGVVPLGSRASNRDLLKSGKPTCLVWYQAGSRTPIKRKTRKVSRKVVANKAVEEPTPAGLHMRFVYTPSGWRYAQPRSVG